MPAARREMPAYGAGLLAAGAALGASAASRCFVAAPAPGSRSPALRASGASAGAQGRPPPEPVCLGTAAVALAAGGSAAFVSQHRALRGLAPRKAEPEAESAAPPPKSVEQDAKRNDQDDELWANDGVVSGSSTIFEMKEQLPGVTGPLGFWDPLKLSENIDEEKFRFYRSAEIKHGRVAMMASIGGVTEHYIRLPYFDNLPPGILENLFRPPVVFGWTFLLGFLIVLEQSVWCDNPDKEPGDYGDPLGFNMYTTEMRNKEINNGRLAMFTGIGILVADLATDKDAVQQLGFL